MVLTLLVLHSFLFLFFVLCVSSLLICQMNCSKAPSLLFLTNLFFFFLALYFFTFPPFSSLVCSCCVRREIVPLLLLFTQSSEKTKRSFLVKSVPFFPSTQISYPHRTQQLYLFMFSAFIITIIIIREQKATCSFPSTSSSPLRLTNAHTLSHIHTHLPLPFSSVTFLSVLFK